MASHWATTFFSDAIFMYPYASEQFSAHAQVSEKDFVGSLQPWLSFARAKNTSGRYAEPDSLAVLSLHWGAHPVTRVFSKAQCLCLPSPLFSVRCAWCSATLEKNNNRLFPEKLSHLLAKFYHVLFSRCRGPLFPACLTDQVLHAQESTSTEDQLTMWESSCKSLPRHVVLEGGYFIRLASRTAASGGSPGCVFVSRMYRLNHPKESRFGPQEPRGSGPFSSTSP